LDIDNPTFDKMYDEFRAAVDQLEQRLAKVFVTSAQDCASLVNLFKAVDTFDGFTDRPTLNQEWARLQPTALKMWHQELITIKEHFVAHKDNPIPFLNAPPAAAAMSWANALLARLQQSQQRVGDLNRALLHS